MADKKLLLEPIEVQLARVRQGEEFFLKVLYETKRAGFISWFQKNYKLDRQAAIDLYHQAFSAFYFNVKDGKIATLSSSIETYLFGIGKNMMKEILRKESRMMPDDKLSDIHFADYSIFNAEEITHKRAIVKDILNKLEDPCKTLLTLYYFANYSLDSIAERMGYKNDRVVKKKKCLCLKSIRSLLLQKKIVRS